MKLLVVSNMYPNENFPSYGVFVKNFCLGLEISGIDYSLAVMCKSKTKLEKLFGYLKFFAESFLKSLFGSYDAVYIHYASHSSAGVLLARKLRKFRLFTNLHGSDAVPENPSQEKMQRYTRAALANSEKVIVPSEYFKTLVSEKYQLPQEKIYVCASGGVNRQVFCPKATERSDVFTMGFVSRITSRKGWKILLDACAQLTDRPWKLIVVGDGPEKEQMLTHMNHLGLQDRIQWYPLLPQQALPDIHRQLDVFIFPTMGESLGLVALEAMACGVPVIASNCTAPADYIQNGVNGYLFPVNDSAALAQTISSFMDLPNRDALRQGAWDTAANYDTDRVIATMNQILTE